MVALSRCLGSLALFLAGADGARVSRKKSAPSMKFIAGVPVLNYQTAYEGKASLGEVGDEEQEWVVMVNPGTSDAQIKKMCKTSKNGCNLVGHPNGGVPFVEMTGTERDLEAVLENAGGAARYVEPDSQVDMIPEIEADVQAATWGLNKIGADQRGRSGAGSTVFILDTGVRVTHQEFNGRAASALDMTSGSLVECNGDLNCAGDVSGHGTHCAGTAAGETVGVAPSASIRAIKVLNSKQQGVWSWTYSALDWLATNREVRPAVGSMSLQSGGIKLALRDAVDAAVNAGVTIVVAGGNKEMNSCAFSPAFIPSAITVGSTDSLDRRSSFSNYGVCTNIWAPGSRVFSAGVWSDDDYWTFSGTSMACPHVAGGAALVLEANPLMKASAVLGDLIENARKDSISGLSGGDNNVFLWVGA